MIERQYGKITFVCDDCGEELNTGTANFDEALAVLRRAKWESYRDEVYKEWQHSCPDCDLT